MASSTEKRARWQAHIQDWKASGLSQRKFCRQNQLSYSMFSYWRTRLNRMARDSRKLIPVTLTAPATLNIYLPCGVRIETPAHLLGQLLPLLQTNPRAD
ncbi:IS66 family insertion sequence element accessory protein TnpA [Sedimenticola hydrogenitrophicus]|uniref:IS66 family insertion sequence element accessory protein TnpA n=1 Tax=Sedimenticola hydrogenitrophicus TaxID=2967975 RepID=UPI0023B203C8|nr:IS66 family insertion sequence element accessory protein TnpB [Sedimenticola hydrogenitrophicus]